ncbi:retrovirus-related pol polyprotein from transposon TNT 1-94 [Tanacetum coccineum]
MNEDKIKKDLEEIETINIELDHRVSKLIAENEHLKQTYKQLYDSIKLARIRSKEQCDDLINQVNLKSVEMLVFRIKFWRAHSTYIKHTQEEAAVLRDLVELAKVNYPLDHSLEYAFRPTGRTFTIVETACPLTRITTTTEVPLRKPTNLENETPKHVVTLVYTRKPRKYKTNVPVSKSKVVQIVQSNLEMITWQGYWDMAFCDSNLKVGFRQHTCFIRNLKGIDLLTRSRGNNLYTLSLGDMMASSPICLLSKASKTKSWLWHRRLSYLNFGTINHVARHALVQGLPKLKFEKDHLCFACAMGKRKKNPHKPKSKYTNQEKLYLLHMDLCGPMRVACVNEKKYILVIVDDYS